MGMQLSDRVKNIVGKGEIALTSNFSFSYNVFKSCLLLIRQNEYRWSKGLKLHRETQCIVKVSILYFSHGALSFLQVIAL